MLSANRNSESSRKQGVQKVRKGMQWRWQVLFWFFHARYRIPCLSGSLIFTFKANKDLIVKCFILFQEKKILIILTQPQQDAEQVLVNFSFVRISRQLLQVKRHTCCPAAVPLSALTCTDWKPPQICLPWAILKEQSAASENGHWDLFLFLLVSFFLSLGFVCLFF